MPITHVQLCVERVKELLDRSPQLFPHLHAHQHRARVPHILPALVTGRLFYYSHPRGYAVTFFIYIVISLVMLIGHL